MRIEDHPVVFKAVVGSHNYNLNISTSDTDWKAYVVPSFTELFDNASFQRSTVGETEDLEIHDTRKLMAHLRKANINFLETIFSSNFIGNNEFYDEVVALVGMRHDIARMNPQYLYNACTGMYIEKIKKWNKTGNPKELMTAYRCLDFLKRFASTGFSDMGRAMYYEDNDPARILMLDIRNNNLALNYTMDDVIKTLAEYKQFVEEKVGGWYEKATVNEETYKNLYDVIYSIVQKQVKKELN